MPMMSPGGSGNLSACEWSTPTNNALDMLEKLAKKSQETTEKISKALDCLQDSIDNYLGWMKWVVPAVNFVNQVLDIVRGMVQVVNGAVQALNKIIPQLVAPWTIRDVGDKMINQFDAKFGSFVNAMAVENFKATYTWTDQNGQYYKGKAVQQRRDGAEPARDSSKKFGESVKQLGEEAIDAVVTFISDVASGLIGIGKEANGLKAVKQAAKAAIKKIAIALQILDLIASIVKFAYQIVSQTHAFISASVSELAQWPEGPDCGGYGGGVQHSVPTNVGPVYAV